MFVDVVRNLNRGHSIDELDQSLRLISEAVGVTGKGGKLILEITVKPSDRGNTETLIVTDKIKLVVPEPDRAAAVFFWDPETREMVRQNPQLRESLFGDIRNEESNKQSNKE